MEASAPPRPVEPPLPAATCGPPSRPQWPRPSVKPPSKIKTTRQVDHTPGGPKHLKSVVLTPESLEVGRIRVISLHGHKPLLFGHVAGHLRQFRHYAHQATGPRETVGRNQYPP